MEKKQSKLISILGFIIFLLGITGILDYYWELRKEKLNQIFPSDVAIFTEATINKNTLQGLKELFPEANFKNLLEEISHNILPFPWTQNINSWMGEKAGIGYFEEEDFMIVLEIRSRSALKQFLDNFKLEKEKYLKKKINNELEIITPAFSSKIALGFHGRWLIIANSPEIIVKSFNAKEKLHDSKKYKQTIKGLPIDSVASVFINTEKTVNLFTSPKYAVIKPIIETIAQTLPHIGIAAYPDKKGISIRTKLLTNEKVFNNLKLKKAPRELMPKLAQFASKNVLFFMSGVDLYEKYKHTKRFLSQMNPQFSLLFEGVLRAKFRELFGENFDFETQFLSLMHSQYAIIIDFKDDLYPFLQFTYLTKFGSVDTNQTLTDFHDAVRSAQSRFTTKVEEVELPDGNIRKELVAVDKEEISIQKINFEGGTYFTIDNEIPDKKFSYGIVDDYLTFSTHEGGMKSILSNKNQTHPNLSENEDFRDSVLFQFSPAESYGFVNFSKLGSALEFLSEKSSPIGNFLKSNIRTATFARKVIPGEVILSAILFAR